MTCSDCGKPLASENDIKFGVCFRDRARSVGFHRAPGWHDQLYGQDLTVRQSQERIVEDAKRMGIDAEPVGERWV